MASIRDEDDFRSSILSDYTDPLPDTPREFPSPDASPSPARSTAASTGIRSSKVRPISPESSIASNGGASPRDGPSSSGSRSDQFELESSSVPVSPARRADVSAEHENVEWQRAAGFLAIQQSKSNLVALPTHVQRSDPAVDASRRAPEARSDLDRQESQLQPRQKSNGASSPVEGAEKRDKPQRDIQAGRNGPAKAASGEGDKSDARKAAKRTPRTRRTWQHEVVRGGALYLAVAVLSIPLSLILVLSRLLLQAIYNSTPLHLHSATLLISLGLIPFLLIVHRSLHGAPQAAISGRVSLSISALGGDVVAISGRRVGSLAGRLAGPEWGALAAQVMLGVGVVGGGMAFALLCLDHARPRGPLKAAKLDVPTLAVATVAAGAYMAHIWLGDMAWTRLLAGSTSAFVQHPERTILLVSLIITSWSLFLSSPAGPSAFNRQVHTLLSARLKLDRRASADLWTLCARLPRQIFPILLFCRLPILIIALRQQIFLRPAPPYLAAEGQVRILSSERGVTGQIVVGEDVVRGYRFLRCDTSILGGRWLRRSAGTGGQVRVDLGDSIFATFPLQEVGMLAYRSDESDSIARTVSISTPLKIDSDNTPSIPSSEKPRDRALIIGLGVGIAAQALSRQSIDIDLVELEPLVHRAATTHFGLSLPSNSTTVNLLDGNEYVSALAAMRRTGEYEGVKWRYVVQDCFTGGAVPEEMFTREFWQDLVDNVEEDGIVAMNFVGIIHGIASKAVLVTLLSVFEQCRAFSDTAEAATTQESINMIVLCTNALSPLLAFRRPTAADVRRSPLRSHVYSTFLQSEIRLYDLLSPDDLADSGLILRRGEGRIGKEGWQVGMALSMWRAMQKILTPEMWMAF